MRHEKISLADHTDLPDVLARSGDDAGADTGIATGTGTVSEAATPIVTDDPTHDMQPAPAAHEEADAPKGPPVLVQHFYYCGRSPARTHAMRGRDRTY
ncbi:hypothetical protein LWE61_11535 [Sphingobium sufflavum]|uniref:hypothetical protein n=1 Tax=Sphingobium sufflavum TaxID=1129547 RepID=UPI001F263A9D|nr:hypothetical protein [Sphingobium sufflavum]MCE7797190.1 hypothetical protein [Sphingobium sufflavum]